MEDKTDSWTIRENEDRTAIPEARIVKYNILSNYYDAKDAIEKYIRTGDGKSVVKASNNLLGLWLQIKADFTKKELKSKEFNEVTKLDFFLAKRTSVPSYALLLRFYFLLQKKLKKMKILDITFPEADVGKDLQRSW
jgi:hypothetical protein